MPTMQVSGVRTSNHNEDIFATIKPRVPARDLLGPFNPLGFERGTFVMMALTGYIDESIDGPRELFNLTCLIGPGSAWFLEQDWLKIINAKNLELIAQGRKPISRYHATDCGTRNEEFEGWGRDEAKTFSDQLLGVLSNYRLDVIGMTVDLRELVEMVPETKPNPVGFAYVTLLFNVMMKLGETTLSRDKDAVLSLIHERCDYDHTLLAAFNMAMADLQFRHRDRFTTIVPLSWRDCTLLQPVDLMAFENMKESERQRKTHGQRRENLTKLLEQGQLGGSLYGVNRDGLLHFKKQLAAMDDITKELILRTAGIRKPQSKKLRDTKKPEV